MKKIEPIMELLMFFINEKDKQKLTNTLSNQPLALQISCLGQAPLEGDLSSFWGFSIEKKQIVFALVPKENSSEILNNVLNELKLNEKHQGLGISVPISSASLALFNLFSKNKEAK